MNLTLGFISFFISIIIPGILFRRFYYYGEFSKQFNTKDPVLHSIFLSIVPGILLQVTAFIFYYLIVGYESCFSDILIIFRDLTSNDTTEIKEKTHDFFNLEIYTFFWYTTLLFAGSGFLGYLTSRAIRLLNWDKKFKLFRFKNQWYYIFSGEVLHLKKFKDAYRVTFDRNQIFEHDISTTYADILIKADDEKKELYTGYVVDYDLNSDDISKLDKIYLLDTHRYKKTDSSYDYFNEGSFTNPQIIRPDNPPSRNRKQVPGDVFIIDASKIVNINLTYVPSLKKVAEKKQKIQKNYGLINFIYFTIVFALILLPLTYNAFGLGDTFVATYMTRTNFWQKLIVFICINQILGFAVPNKKNEEGELIYDWGNILTRLGWAILWVYLSWHFVLSTLPQIVIKLIE